MHGKEKSHCNNYRCIFSLKMNLLYLIHFKYIIIKFAYLTRVLVFVSVDHVFSTFAMNCASSRKCNPKTAAFRSCFNYTLI
jgi:hypothetical protein